MTRLGTLNVDGSRMKSLATVKRVAVAALVAFAVMATYSIVPWWVLWSFFGCLAILAAYHHLRVTRPAMLRRERQRRGECPHCGYDLGGSQSSLCCPECGENFEVYAKAKVS